MNKPNEPLPSSGRTAVWRGVTAAVLGLLLCLTGARTPAATLAYWQFEPGNLGADSSGNGHALTVTAITESSDVATNAPGSGSAAFDGLSSFANTTATLDLSGTNRVTIEFFAKFTDVNPKIFFANATWTDGAVYLSGDESVAPGNMLVVQKAAAGQSEQRCPYLADGAWHHYGVTIDQSGPDTAMHIYIDGNLQTSTGAQLGARNLVNDVLFLGMWPAGGYQYNGLLDEVRISSGLLTPYEFLNAPTNPVIAILQQPRRVTVESNSAVTFRVTAAFFNGDPAQLQYEWRRAGASIAGATRSSYTLFPATGADEGVQFEVVVSAPGASSVTSSSASFTFFKTLAYWRFEPGTLEADSSGNGNTLTITGITSSSEVPTNGPGTGSAVFDGASYAQTAGPLALSNYNALTFEFFAKFTTGSVDMFFSHSDPNVYAGGFYLDINEVAGNLKLSQSTASGWETRLAPYPNDGGWHHYAVTIDQSASAPEVKIFADGLRADTGGDTGSIQSFLDDIFTIGAFATTGYKFHGQMDEVRISNGVLPPSLFLIGAVTNPVVIIIQQPANTHALQNEPATFTVGAAITNGNPLQLQYQWQRNGMNIPGATVSSYTLPAATLGDNGVPFRVLISAPNASPVFSAIAQVVVTLSTTLAHWRFEAGNPGADSSGNGNHLTINGVSESTDVSAAAPGTGSAVFDGLSAFAQTTSILPLSSYTTFTVEFFAKFQTWEPGIFIAGENYSAGGFYIDKDESAGDGQFKVAQAANGFSTKLAPYPIDGGWHHYAVTINESGPTAAFELFIDGVLVTDTTGTTQASMKVRDDLYFLGKWPAGGYQYNGQMDEVRISGGILAPSQFLVGPPTLWIGLANGDAVIHWPASGLDYTLEQASSLAGTWSAVTNTPTLSRDGGLQVTVPTPANAMFFRLAR